MTSVDELIAGLAGHHPLLFATAIALLLGLRHATDPDHLTAVAGLAVRDGDGRGAARLGLAWGLGHGAAIVVFGLPIILLARLLPESLRVAVEVAVGCVIVVLGIRLLRGHRHAPSAGRSPSTALGVGLMHGTAGSAGATLLLLSGVADPKLAIVALLLFVVGTAASMSLCSAGMGVLAARGSTRFGSGRLVVPLGLASVLFGAWYIAASVQFLPAWWE
ncbi:MAG: hypothetical protein ACR2J9_07895 [Gaiellales bacterium]